jgi:hypothetical protein
VADPLLTRIRKQSVALVNAALPELTPYPYVVSDITVPCIMAFPPDSIMAGQSQAGPGEVFDFGAFDVGRTTVTLTLRIYVSRTQGAGDQDALDAYVSPDGDKSIWQIFDRNPTLDGACAVCHVTEIRNYGNWPVGAQTFLGVEIVLAAEA